MASDKTRPIGSGVRNIPTTLTHSDAAEIQRLADLSGVGRSPYLRALAKWAIENRVLVRPRKDEYIAHIDAIKAGQKSAAYGYEIVVTQFTKPITVMLDHRENVLEFADDHHSLRVAETPTPTAAVASTPATLRKRRN